MLSVVRFSTMLLATGVSIAGTTAIRPPAAVASAGDAYTCTQFGTGLTFTLKQSNDWTIYITNQYYDRSGDGSRAAYATNAKGRRVINGKIIFGSSVESDVNFRFVWTDQKHGEAERDYSFRMARVGTDRTGNWATDTFPHHYLMADMHSTDPYKRDPDLDWTPVGASRFACEAASIEVNGKPYKDYNVGMHFVTD